MEIPKKSQISLAYETNPTQQQLDLDIETHLKIALQMFPFKEPYKQQVDSMRAIITALHNKQNLLFQSPTGTGKSLMLLCSTLSYLEITENKDYQILYLTRTKGQINGLIKELDKIKALQHGLSHKYAILAGRMNLCLKKEAFKKATQNNNQLKENSLLKKFNEFCEDCKLKTNKNRMEKDIKKERILDISKEHTIDKTNKIFNCPTAKEEEEKKQTEYQQGCEHYALNHFIMKNQKEFNGYSRVKFILDGGTNARLPDIEDIVELFGQEKAQCPYYFNKYLANSANIVFMTYLYLLNPQILNHVSKKVLDNCSKHIIVFDEAHNIEEIAEDEFSSKLKLKTVVRCIEMLESIEKGINKAKNLKILDLIREIGFKLLEKIQETKERNENNKKEREQKQNNDSNQSEMDISSDDSIASEIMDSQEYQQDIQKRENNSRALKDYEIYQAIQQGEQDNKKQKLNRLIDNFIAQEEHEKDQNSIKEELITKKNILRNGLMDLDKDKEKLKLFLKKILNFSREISKSQNKAECGLISELDFMSKYYRLFEFPELSSTKNKGGKNIKDKDKKEEKQEQEMNPEITSQPLNQENNSQMQDLQSDLQKILIQFSQFARLWEQLTQYIRQKYSRDKNSQVDEEFKEIIKTLNLDSLVENELFVGLQNYADRTVSLQKPNKIFKLSTFYSKLKDFHNLSTLSEKDREFAFNKDNKKLEDFYFSVEPDNSVEIEWDIKVFEKEVIFKLGCLSGKYVFTKIKEQLSVHSMILSSGTLESKQVLEKSLKIQFEAYDGGYVIDPKKQLFVSFINSEGQVQNALNQEQNQDINSEEQQTQELNRNTNQKNNQQLVPLINNQASGFNVLSKAQSEKPLLFPKAPTEHISKILIKQNSPDNGLSNPLFPLFQDPKQQFPTLNFSFGKDYMSNTEVRINKKRNLQMALNIVQKIISEVLRSGVKGGILIFFKNYELMNSFVPIFKEPETRKALNNIHFYVENKNNAEFQVDFADFKKLVVDKQETVLFLAASRGKLSEGIDMKDDLARCIIILGVPFLNIGDPYFVCKSKYVKRVLQMNEKEWSRRKAARIVNQAAGRSIRHKTDWGSIFFVCESFDQPSHSRNLKNYISDWILMGEKKSEDLIQEFASFLEQKKAEREKIMCQTKKLSIC